jgi:hypothetical protein
MMKRLFHYCAFALAACFGQALFERLERPAFFLAASLKQVFELPGVAATRFKMAMASWRTSNSTDAGIPASSLRASSNHFVIGNAAGLPEKVGWLG